MSSKENDPEKKNAVEVLRKRFYRIKDSIKPSEKLKELLRQHPKKNEDESEEVSKKVARPSKPLKEVDL